MNAVYAGEREAGCSDALVGIFSAACCSAFPHITTLVSFDHIWTVSSATGFCEKLPFLSWLTSVFVINFSSRSSGYDYSYACRYDAMLDTWFLSRVPYPSAVGKPSLLLSGCSGTKMDVSPCKLALFSLLEHSCKPLRRNWAILMSATQIILHADFITLKSHFAFLSPYFHAARLIG